MAIRKRKPTSPGRRFQTSSDFAEVTTTSPEKSLLAKKSSTGGRNNYGRKTARHRGGGHKQRYRIVDFRRNKDGIPATVASIEYDPNRNCRIALLHYHDGEKRYILAPKGVSVGDLLESGQGSDIRPGNALPMRYIPVGTVIHAVELKVGGGARMARSAGTSVQLVAKEGTMSVAAILDCRCRPCCVDREPTSPELDLERQPRPTGGELRIEMQFAVDHVHPTESEHSSDPRACHRRRVAAVLGVVVVVVEVETGGTRHHLVCLVEPAEPHREHRVDRRRQ